MKAILLSVVLATTILTGCQVAQSGQSHSTTKAVQGQIEQNKTERNKANVLAFYDLAFNQHKVQEAADKYIGDVYLQHNPMVEDGKEAFVKRIGGFISQAPQARSHIKRVIAEGDLVVLHIHSQPTPDSLGRAVVDIFRFDENGKIVEHWDVIQDVPAKTASGRTMF